MSIPDQHTGQSSDKRPNSPSLDLRLPKRSKLMEPPLASDSSDAALDLDTDDEDDFPVKKLDKGKGRAKPPPDLPNTVWERIFEFYYDAVCDDWHYSESLSHAMTPLLLSKDLTAISLPVLYRHPHIGFSNLTAFNRCIKVTARYHDITKVPMVRHLTIRPSLSVPQRDSPKISPVTKEALHGGAIHPGLTDLRCHFPQLHSFTLRDTLILNAIDAFRLIESLKLISPQKARLEIRMWDLHASPIGQSLIAGSYPNIHAPMNKSIAHPLDMAVRNLRYDRPRDGGAFIMQECWRDALVNGRQIEFPSWWTDPPPQQDRNQNPQSQQAQQAAVNRNAIRHADISLPAPGSAEAQAALQQVAQQMLQASQSVFHDIPGGPGGAEGPTGAWLIPPSTVPPSYNFVGTRTGTDPGVRPQAQPDELSPSSAVDQCPPSVTATSASASTSILSSSSTPGYSDVPIYTSPRSHRLTNQRWHANFPFSSLDRSAMESADPDVTIFDQNPDETFGRPSEVPLIHRTQPSSSIVEAETDRFLESPSPSIPERPLPALPLDAATQARRDRTDHIWTETPTDLRGDERPPSSDVAGEPAVSAILLSPERPSTSALNALPTENVGARNDREYQNPDSYMLAHRMRDDLLDLLENYWTPRLEAFSFVALDPLSSLIVRSPDLDFWPNISVPHIRVHLPRGIDSLAVFKGAKEIARDRVRRQREDGSPQPDTLVNEKDLLFHVGGDGTGGNLVHLDNKLFEIEVNTLAEMRDDTWEACGNQLPPQVCRVLVGEQDWRAVRHSSSVSTPSPLLQQRENYCPSPSTAGFLSPAFSFTSLGCDEDVVDLNGDIDDVTARMLH